MNATAAVVDTNVLIYAYDHREPAKREVAAELVARLARDGDLLLSAQVLNEFYSRTTRSRAQAPALLLPGQAAQVIRELCDTLIILPVTQDTTLMALQAAPRYSIQFWDALIWAAAKLHGVPTIYTEDFTHDREVEGVRFVNPFVSTTP